MKKQSKLWIIFLLLITGFCIQSHTKIEVFNLTNLQANTYQKSKTHIKHLAVFIRFSGSEANVTHHLDDAQSVENASKIFNSDSPLEMDTVNGLIPVPSFKTYYEKQSYGKLSITTEIFPKVDGTVVSYTDPNPIGYYLKYNDTNPIGYQNQSELQAREAELVNRAVAYISTMVETEGIRADELDIDSDSNIDAISFIIEGQQNLPSNIVYGDLLWSHKKNSLISETIQGKNINAYALIYADDYTEVASLFSMNRGTYGTIIHEFGHILGYRDLYRPLNPTSQPVGFYDIMGNVVGSNPQDFLTYYISEYNDWHDPLPVITGTTKSITVYKPNYTDPSEQRAVKIKTSGVQDEFFVVEYHEKKNTYESHSADSSGIIVYRVNEKNKYLGNTDGSSQGKNDHVYIFRPNETGLGEGLGNLNQATLNMTRNTFGSDILLDTTFNPEAIFFSDGSNSGIKIEVTNETSDSITFDVLYPETKGNGTKEDPYQIDSVKTFLYFMRMDTKNKYYQLTNDLDFKEYSYPILNFEGNLDGNYQTIYNIQTNGAGIFNMIGNYQTHTTMKNLYVENLTVYSNNENYLGGFASVAENVTLSNIHLKNGTVVYEGNSINDIVSVGGFVGNANNATIIENCSSNVDVSANKNVGGFIGINMNAKIKNSFVTGNVQGNHNVGAFIGLQAITDSIYNIPMQAYYWDLSIPSVGGYAGSFHHLSVLDASSLGKGITAVSFPSEQVMLQDTSMTIPSFAISGIQLNYRVENERIVEYTDGKLVGLQAGTTRFILEFMVGTFQIQKFCNVTVKENASSFTEEEVLKILHLSKKDTYVVGFEIGTEIKDFKQKIENCKGVVLKHFIGINHTELNEGLLGTGMQFTLSFGEKEYTYTIVVKGDVNGDGQIYATDYVKLKNHIMEKSNLTGPYLLAADINNDGLIYATDYVQIKNHIMGKKLIEQTF